MNEENKFYRAQFTVHAGRRHSVRARVTDLNGAGQDQLRANNGHAFLTIFFF